MNGDTCTFNIALQASASQRRLPPWLAIIPRSNGMEHSSKILSSYAGAQDPDQTSQGRFTREASRRQIQRSTHSLSTSFDKVIQTSQGNRSSTRFLIRDQEPDSSPSKKSRSLNHNGAPIPPHCRRRVRPRHPARHLRLHRRLLRPKAVVALLHRPRHNRRGLPSRAQRFRSPLCEYASEVPLHVRFPRILLRCTRGALFNNFRGRKSRGE